LLLVIGSLTIGELVHSKDAGPLAFLVGGTMMIGGLAVGLMRSLGGKRDRA
jgi:hypothetical protein